MLPRTLFASLVMVAAATCLLPGCLACPQEDCGQILTVAFIRDQWPAGEYEISVTADGVATTCTATLPFASCENAVSCDRSDHVFMVLSSSCSRDSDEHRLDGVQWYGRGQGPAEVAVELRHEGTLLGSASAAPIYDTYYPSGERCGPACEEAEQITLSW